MTLNEEIELLASSIEEIPVQKKYWLVRTQSGIYYDTFRKNGVIALDHNEVPLSYLSSLRTSFQEDSALILNGIRNRVIDIHQSLGTSNPDIDFSTRRSSLVASQIFKFVFEIKKGDVVLIPSTHSDVISFGVVNEGYIGDFTPEELRRIETDAILKKRVKWLKHSYRVDLDPYLYRTFTSHQAVSDVSSYAEIIERSLKDLFIIDDEAHLIINVETEEDILAKDLFGLGSNILNIVDEFSEAFDLGVSSKDISVTINLNSPGKIDFKSKIKKTTMVAGLVLALFGGGYRTKGGTSIDTPGLPGLIKAISEFLSDRQERALKREAFDRYKDSLKIKDVEDLNKLLKQFSENKDLPK